MQKIITTLFSAFLFIGSYAQVSTIAVQDFDTIATPAWNYTVTQGTASFLTDSSSANDGPATSPFGIGGSWAWETNGQSGGVIFEFANVSLAGYTDVYITYRIAAFSVGAANNGLDAPDHVTPFVSVDGGTTYYERKSVTGFSNAYWEYAATGMAVDTFATANNTATFAPAAGGLRTTDGFSTAIIHIPNNFTQVRLQLESRESTTAERWCIDNVAVMGTPAVIGIAENNSETLVSVYPSPANEKVTVEVKRAKIFSSVQLFNVLGEKAMPGNIVSDKNATIDVSWLKEGIYFLRIETGNESITKKITVVH